LKAFINRSIIISAAVTLLVCACALWYIAREQPGRFVKTDPHSITAGSDFILIRNSEELTLFKPENSQVLFSDAETGPGTALHLGQRFPSPGAYGAIQETMLVNRAARYFGQGYQLLGIDAVMAPVADMSPLSPIVGWRSYGDTIEIAQPALRAMIQGLADGGVIPIVKHYPGHGATRTDSHTTVSRIVSNWSEFKRNDLELFKQLLTLSETGGVMVAFISAPEKQAGWPHGSSDLAIVSSFWMNMLRQDWNFQGLVISDAVNMAGMKQFKNPQYYCASQFFNLGGDLIIGNPSESLLSRLEDDEAIPDINRSVMGKFMDRVSENRKKRRSINREALLSEGEELCQQVAEKALVSFGNWPSLPNKGIATAFQIPKGTDKEFFQHASLQLGLQLVDKPGPSTGTLVVALVKGSGLRLNALSDESLGRLKTMHERGTLAGCIVIGNPLNAILLDIEGIPSLVCWGPSDCSLDAARRWLNGEIKAEGRWPYPKAAAKLRKEH